MCRRRSRQSRLVARGGGCAAYRFGKGRTVSVLEDLLNSTNRRRAHDYIARASQASSASDEDNSPFLRTLKGKGLDAERYIGSSRSSSALLVPRRRNHRRRQYRARSDGRYFGSEFVTPSILRGRSGRFRSSGGVDSHITRRGFAGSRGRCRGSRTDPRALKRETPPRALCGRASRLAS